MLDVWDKYFRYGYDVTISEYLGRGHEHFYDEIQRLFEWMKLHRRNFFPKDFTVGSVRESDNFFWYLEFHDPPTNVIVPPLKFSARKPLEIKGSLTATNGLIAHCGSGGGTVYYSPEMLDLSKKMTLNLPGRAKNRSFEPSAEVLLEDVRTRGDRQHPFWAKIDYGK